MAVVSIKFHEEVDNEPEELQTRGELYQGETYTNYKIFELVNDDGSKQYMKIGIVHNSYGDAEDVENPTLAKPEQKTVTVWR